MCTSVRKISVVMPVYNELMRVTGAVNAVLAISQELQRRFGVALELIIVNDGSSDGTKEIVQGLAAISGVLVLHHPLNRGKGAAVRTGFENASGEIVVIQDADCEYQAATIPELVGPIIARQADAVYGSRYIRGQRHGSFDQVGHSVLNTLIWAASGFRLRLTDMETCQKAFRRSFLAQMKLRSNSFTIEPELTLKLFRAGAQFTEVGIDYDRRVEGKKVKILKDGLKAAAAIVYHGVKTFLARRPSDDRRCAV